MLSQITKINFQAAACALLLAYVGVLYSGDILLPLSTGKGLLLVIIYLLMLVPLYYYIRSHNKH